MLSEATDKLLSLDRCPADLGDIGGLRVDQVPGLPLRVEFCIKAIERFHLEEVREEANEMS